MGPIFKNEFQIPANTMSLNWKPCKFRLKPHFFFAEKWTFEKGCRIEADYIFKLTRNRNTADPHWHLSVELLCKAS